jgi:hypothetical protein
MVATNMLPVDRLTASKRLPVSGLILILVVAFVTDGFREKEHIATETFRDEVLVIVPIIYVASYAGCAPTADHGTSIDGADFRM